MSFPFTWLIMLNNDVLEYSSPLLSLLPAVRRSSIMRERGRVKISDSSEFKYSGFGKRIRGAFDLVVDSSSSRHRGSRLSHSFSRLFVSFYFASTERYSSSGERRRRDSYSYSAPPPHARARAFLLLYVHWSAGCWDSDSWDSLYS